mmetsp:Transcript_90939/g.180802  ORF Transcript_90939/g.180802 Transcript_90939/m.180802 type:complete len:333 (-) Transcript_90939:34-1032(-)
MYEKAKAISTSDPTVCSDPSVAATALAAMTTEKLLVPTIERLAAENVALREACAEANERLAQLEEEKQQFLDEGVFDLVNSVCGKSGTANADGSFRHVRTLQCGSSIACSSPGGAHDNVDGLQALLDTAEAAASAVDGATAGGASSTGASSLPQALNLQDCSVCSTNHSQQSPLAESPLKSEIEVHMQLSPEDIQKRSEELSGENERLRQELACSGKYGETLQLEQQEVEDHMHALEQEHRWLAQCLQGQFAEQSSSSAAGAVDGEVPPQSSAHLRPEETESEAPADARAGGPCIQGCGSPHEKEQVLLESLTMKVFEHSPSSTESSRQAQA